jgi:hypothetical protein
MVALSVMEPPNSGLGTYALNQRSTPVLGFVIVAICLIAAATFVMRRRLRNPR